MTISEKLKRVYPKLSPGKRKIANYINENPQIAAYCTASSIAKAVGVANAQVVKFTKDLGFGTYKELQAFIRENVEQWVSMPSISHSWLETELDDMEANCLRLVNQNIENINLTFKNVAFSQMQAIADLISTAGRVGFVGSKGAADTNSIPAAFLAQMRPDVYRIDPDINTYRDVLKWWGKSDVLIGANIFGCGKDLAVDMLDYGKQNGCATVWFTDMESFMQTPKKNYDHTVKWVTRSAVFSSTTFVALLNVIVYLVSSRLNRAMGDILHCDPMSYGLYGITSPPQHVQCFAPPSLRETGKM